VIDTRVDAADAAMAFLRDCSDGHPPVIIEVVELDTWWRVFYAWDRHNGTQLGSMSPIVVPLSVDKAWARCRSSGRCVRTSRPRSIV
jgi:hypothetical protein